MASLTIHMAVGKRFIEKQNIKNIADFYKGNIAPDLANDKFASHYTGVKEKNDLILFLCKKVQL